MNVSKRIYEFFLIMLGNFLLAFAVSQFILPNAILSGGVSSVAILLRPFIPGVSEELIIVFLYVVFTILCFLFLGREYLMKTLLSSIFYPFFLMLCSRFLANSPIDPLLAAIFGGFISGAGIGIVFRQGASTGGMDIPPLIVNKYFGFDISRCVMVSDVLTILCGLWIYNLEAVLLGLIAVYVSSMAIDYMMKIYQPKNAQRFEIVSSKADLISQAINQRLERGTTIYYAEGGYTALRRRVVVCVVAYSEHQQVIDIVEEFDKNAFVVVSDTAKVNGEGFSFSTRF